MDSEITKLARTLGLIDEPPQPPASEPGITTVAALAAIGIGAYCAVLVSIPWIMGA